MIWLVVSQFFFLFIIQNLENRNDDFVFFNTYIFLDLG